MPDRFRFHHRPPRTRRRQTLVKIPSFISAVKTLAPTKVPASRLDRVNRTLRRRFDDIIDEAFQHACITGDLETAADVVDLLERKLERWVRANGPDSRNVSEQIAHMRDELERRRTPQPEDTA